MITAAGLTAVVAVVVVVLLLVAAHDRRVRTHAAQQAAGYVFFLYQNGLDDAMSMPLSGIASYKARFVSVGQALKAMQMTERFVAFIARRQKARFHVIAISDFVLPYASPVQMRGRSGSQVTLTACASLSTGSSWGVLARAAGLIPGKPYDYDSPSGVIAQVLDRNGRWMVTHISAEPAVPQCRR